MKGNIRKILLSSLTCAAMALAACGNANTVTVSDVSASSTTGESVENRTQTVTVREEGTLSDPSDSSREATGSFSVNGGSVSQEGSVYTISQAGEYTLSGRLDGQLVVNLSEEDQVKLILNNTLIYCTDGAPILVTGGDEIEIEAAAGSYNVIADGRDSSTAENEEYDAAVYAECDLKMSGSGILIVDGSFENGIKSKDDVTLKNLTLKISAVGNAIKGNDSVKIKSGNIILISTDSDGIKTKNTDVSSKGNQRGTVTIESGHVDIYAASDGIDASYNAEITGEDAVLYIFTADYANGDTPSAQITAVQVGGAQARGMGPGGFGGFGENSFEGTSSGKDNDGSYKGIKAGNEIIISGGSIVIKAADDGLHANGGDELENGSDGTGNVTVSDAEITITSSDDGIHADNTINIISGTVNVAQSHEGIEANQILVSGGSTFVCATDDGMNASGSLTTPLIQISGGYVDVTTSSGDTDGVDSNGNIVVTGGFLIVKGGSANGNMAGSIDADGSVSVTGGTVVALGGVCTTPENGSVNTFISSGTSFEAGSYSVTDSEGEEILSFELTGNYSSCWISSDKIETGETYTLTCDGAVVLSWTQESSTVGSSGNSGMGGGPGGSFGGFGNDFGGGSGGGRGPGR